MAIPSLSLAHFPKQAKDSFSAAFHDKTSVDFIE
jgi:hypothetical protein